MLVGGLHLHYVVGYLLATQFSTLWNFGWIETWAFKSVSPRIAEACGSAACSSSTTLRTSHGTAVLLATVVGINYLVADLLTLGLVFLLRFLFAERIWAPRPTPAAQT